MRLGSRGAVPTAGIVAMLLAAACTGERGEALVARKEPVVDRYHGVEVRDDYRWLERSGDPRVHAFAAAQTAAARAWLDAVPGREAIAARVAELMRPEAATYADLRWVAGTLFAMRRGPGAKQPALVAMDRLDAPGSARVVVDPNVLDPAGTTAIDFYVPSFDARLVAVSLSRGGSETGDLGLWEVASGTRLGDAIPRVNAGTAGGSVAWNAGGTGLWYTRYPRPGEMPDDELYFHQKLYFHAIGDDPANDREELGGGLPRIAEIRVASTPDGRRVLASVQNGDSGSFRYFVRDPDGTWSDLAGWDDRCVHAALASDGSIYLVSRSETPDGEVLRVPAASRTLADARVVVPPVGAPIETDFYADAGLTVAGDRLYLRVQRGGPDAVMVFDRDGRPHGELPSLPISAVDEVVPLGNGDVLFRNESYLAPPAWFRFDAASGERRETALSEPAAVDLSGFEVVREWAVSKDGTKVPVTVVRARGAGLDGARPTLLTGYGGYGLSRRPRYRDHLAAWLERGGVFAEANIRGGGEFGESWHRSGALTSKQNVFDDFAAAARHLIEAGYTRPERLAIEGGSNGGLLMGAMITQHPDLFRAVVSHVGIYDMLRTELSPNGAFNIPEFGTVKDPEQFRALFAYSPYHHVVDGTPYPAVLMLTGENDPRVEPWQSLKMAARLQAATASPSPILLLTSASSGHGVGTSQEEKVAQQTDVYAFLFRTLGVGP